MDPGPTFVNPVIRGFNPDPTICAVRGERETRFFVSTSTFEFFPGCAIHTSTDLVNWTLVGHALTRRSQMDLRTVEPGAGSWASTLRYRPGGGAAGGGGGGGKGRFYLANGLFMRYRPADDERVFPRGFYVYTDDIWDSSAWSDPVYFDNPGFDQDLFWDDATSKVYLCTTVRLAKRPSHSSLKDFAIHISEIELATGRTLTAPQVIRQSVHGIAEGSHLLRKDGYYYLFTAEGGTEAGHQEWVSRSRVGPYGPWESQGKALWYNGPDEEVQRTGHADVVEDGQGRWWAVLLAVRPVKADDGSFLEPQLGRETFLVKVDWVDDWPVFNDGRNIRLETRGRDSVVQVAPRKGDVKWRAASDAAELDVGWYQKNTPVKACYSLTERRGHVRLYGNCYDLSRPEAPAMLLRKQSSYTESFHATMQFRPSRPGYEAGVVLWWNQYSYASLGLTLREHPDDGPGLQTAAVLRRPAVLAGVRHTTYRPVPWDERAETAAGTAAEIRPEPVQLTIRAGPSSYTLSLRTSRLVWTGEPIPARELTTTPPVGAAFGGVMFGLYGFGNGEPVLDPADFSDMYIEEG